MQISDIIAAVSVAVAVATYIADRLTARRERTIVSLDRLIESRTGLPRERSDPDYYIKTRRFLGKVERLCMGVKEGYYSAHILKAYGSKFLSDLYKKDKEYIIDHARKLYKDPGKFRCLEYYAVKFGKKSRNEADANDTL